MDQIKIGKFIQQKRKELNLTQKEIAEKLNVSDKTISKWETGNGLPEVSLMMPLCEILKISVNELLCGEKVDEKNYQAKAEENMLILVKEKQENNKKLILEFLVIFMTLLAGFTLILVAGLLETKIWLRVLLIVIAFIVIFSGVIVACVLEKDAGVYECKHCKNKFVPSMKDFIKAPNMGFTRKLKCPKCGKKSYCKKRLSK